MLPSAGARSTETPFGPLEPRPEGEASVGRPAQGNQRLAVHEARWGDVLFLLENEHLATHGRPARFGAAAAFPPFAQFPQWPALYQAAVASGRHQPGQRIQETILAITRALTVYYPADQVRQLTLSAVVSFLRRPNQSAGEAGESGAPATAGDGRPGGGEVGPAQGQGGGTLGMTAEQRVRRCLVGNPTASMDQVKRATELTEWKIRKTAAWKGHEERLFDDYLTPRPEATAGEVAAAFGCSTSKVVGTHTWREHQSRRRAAGPERQAKEQPLTRATLACRPDDTANDPAKLAEARDQLFRQVLETADPDTQARP